MKTETPMWKACRAVDGLLHLMLCFGFEYWSEDEMVDFIDAHGGIE